MEKKFNMEDSKRSEQILVMCLPRMTQNYLGKKEPQGRGGVCWGQIARGKITHGRKSYMSLGQSF